MHKIDEIQCSLEKTSLDDRDNVTKEYMTHSQLRVCAFDDVKKWYVREKIPFANPNPKSNDALYFEEDECFFIEFKNGRITDQVNFEINKKIYDSLFILFDLNYNYCDGMCSVGGKGEECITICVRPSGKYVNPVSARLASKSREGVKRFVDMQVWSTDGVEDENYEFEKELYNVNDCLLYTSDAADD